ncbi:ubiquitin-2 like Rad60 SUMO-like-domain-containing protein, partial [Gilbertella persicaria]|uniref:ubiquitin-2 like Rad60 SUMO-like-domain-containing protein n=1 Tax=Gilbertella persicaria TaxID=101096 RepID=UPI00221E57E6
MSDFDITNVRARNSFLASLKKRKAFGLNDSDSDSETEQVRKLDRKKKHPSPPKENKLSNTTQNNNTNNNNKDANDMSRNIHDASDNNRDTNDTINEPEPLSDVNPYLISTGPALEQIKALSRSAILPIPSPPSTNEKSASYINLSDDEAQELPSIPDAQIEDLDPELAALLENSQNKPETHSEPQKISIRLQYQHNLAELSEKSKSLVEKLMKPIKIIIMDNVQFHKVMDAFCMHKKLKKSEVVLVYNEETVFLSATPSGVGMSPIGTNNMQVYPKHCFDVMKQQKEKEKQERLKRIAEAKNDDNDDFEIPKFESDVPTQNTEEGEDRIILKLRESDKKEVFFRIRPSSVLSSLVQSYKARTGMDSNTKMMLIFEGEELDHNLKIEDTELEHEDIVEVKI